MGNLLTKELLLQREKMEVKKVEFENGDFVFVREMTGYERDCFEQSLLRRIPDRKGGTTFEQTTENFRAKFAVCVMCDEEGKLLLDPKQYNELSKSMSARRLEKIVEEAQKLNNITEEAKEELIKNSDADQVGNSISDSVEN
jgi:hypothetical protein